jgi:uncharacterized protein YutE (UPF0331/DUF86 family)
MVVDRRYVERFLSEIEENVALLEQIRNEPADTLFGDRLKNYGIQHALQIAVEAVIAVAHHVIAEGGLPRPEQNTEIFAIMTNNGILQDRELAARLPAMVRFRNLLVHRYWRVDTDVVYQILRQDLNDFRTFAREMEGYLQRTEGDG